jgi:hypothetical protein
MVLSASQSSHHPAGCGDPETAGPQPAPLRRPPDYAHVETDLIGLHMHNLRRRADLGEAPPEEIVERTLRIRF